MRSAELLVQVLAQVPPDEARRRADEILSQPEYQPPEPSVFDRFFDWLSERFGDLISGVGEGASNTVVAVLILAVLIGAVAFVVVRTMRRTGRVGQLASPGVTVEVEPRRSRHEWEELALRHEAAGEWRDALRCRYRALVVGCIDRGWLRDIPGRTAGEFRRELATTAPDAAGPFADASDLFERAWYGSLPTGPDESARFQADAARVEGR